MKRNKTVLACAFGSVLLSTSFIQAQIPTNGLVLYLNGNTGVEEAVGDSAEGNDPVVRWLDQSSTGNHVSTNGFAGTTTPTYRTGLVNGRSAVEFGIDADTERLLATTPLITGTTDFSLFAVINIERTLGARYIAGNYGFGNFGGLEFYVNNGNLTLYDGGQLTGTASLATNKWYLVQAEKSGSTYTLRVNNSFDGSGTLGGSVGGGANWSVGNGPNYNSEAYYGDIGAHLVYTRALTAEERLFVANSLADNFLIGGVPEPTTMALLGITGGLIFWRRSRR